MSPVLLALSVCVAFLAGFILGLWVALDSARATATAAAPLWVVHEEMPAAFTAQQWAPLRRSAPGEAALAPENGCGRREGPH